ncbi:MAG: hypothetical protein U0S12_14085 [Fimbriimonadales bacterium]
MLLVAPGGDQRDSELAIWASSTPSPGMRWSPAWSSLSFSSFSTSEYFARFDVVLDILFVALLLGFHLGSAAWAAGSCPANATQESPITTVDNKVEGRIVWIPD